MGAPFVYETCIKLVAQGSFNRAVMCLRYAILQDRRLVYTPEFVRLCNSELGEYIAKKCPAGLFAMPVRSLIPAMQSILREMYPDVSVNL